MSAKILELSQALSSRLFHDLSGPVSVINSCLNLCDIHLKDDINQSKIISHEAKLLAIKESESLIRRIKFFRSAYAISGEEEVIELKEVSKLALDFFQDTRIQLNLDFTDEEKTIDADIAKIIICLLAILSQNINYQGVIDLQVSGVNQNTIKLSGSGLKLNLISKRRLNIIQGKKIDYPINVENCREHYINMICQEKNYRIRVNQNSKIVEYVLIKLS